MWVLTPSPEGMMHYQPPFAFTGKLNKLTVKVDRPQLTPADIKKLESAQQAVEKGRE